MVGGLVRFDGFNFRLIQEENSTLLPVGPVRETALTLSCPEAARLVLLT